KIVRIRTCGSRGGLTQIADHNLHAFHQVLSRNFGARSIAEPGSYNDRLVLENCGVLSPQDSGLRPALSAASTATTATSTLSSTATATTFRAATASVTAPLEAATASIASARSSS